MNERQRQALREESAKTGCQVCHKPATIVVVWSFVDTTQNDPDHPILTFIRCADHVEAARSQRPEAPAYIRVDITEETLTPRPLVLS
jgi:hypothetical protein